MTPALEAAREAMRATGQWHAGQQMGRRWAIGCVALEVTQRCNLDCTLCYLSESAEALRDLPLEELYRRIDGIRDRYGSGTDVQITGGEPTLRRRADLLAIVARARQAGLRSTLFTNGIRATRDLLADLCGAGLEAVAFHVDTTQQRSGYASESDLNALRDEYMARARGLPLGVYFNTTVHDGNFDSLPGLVRFFVSRAGAMTLASFQLQADTGRGVLRERGPRVTPDSVAARVREGAGAWLDFDVLRAGHKRCNRLALALVANGQAYDLLDEPRTIGWALEETAHLRLGRVSQSAPVRTLAAWAVSSPGTLLRCVAWLARKAWRMKRDLFAARGRVHKLTFFIHNFMDACDLEQERLDACVFHVASAGAPLSMCAHNARRDDHLVRPISMSGGYWHPATGLVHERPIQVSVRLTRKTARGRARA